MAIAQFQNLPIIFRLKIRVKFQIHGKIYKRMEKIFFRVFGNTRKKKNSVYLEDNLYSTTDKMLTA